MIVRYGRSPNGMVRLKVQMTEHVSALIEGHSAEDQDAMDRAAESIAAAAVIEAGLRQQIADRDAEIARVREACARLRAEGDDRERRLQLVLGVRIPSAAGEMAAREEADGSVWVGVADDSACRHGWRGHFAMRFRSWAELRQACPDLAPAGLRIDTDGRPAVILQPLPVRAKGAGT